MTNSQVELPTCQSPGRRYLDFVTEMYADSIEQVRRGDIGAAKKMLVATAHALREQTTDGRNNLSAPYATYLAEVLETLARSENTARLFCLGMPNNRPTTGDDSMHVSRALSILDLMKNGLTAGKAIHQVALAEHKSREAIRSSWKKGRLAAQVQFNLRATPQGRDEQSKEIP